MPPFSASTTAHTRLGLAPETVTPMRPRIPSGRPCALEFLPGGSAVDGFVQSAARATAVHAPGRAPRLPQCRVQDVGIAGIEGDVDAAGLGVLVEDLLPGLAAVAGAEDPALFVVGKGMPQRSDEGDVRILRVDDQASDGMGIGQADEFPGRAGIDRLVHAVTAHDIAADAGFAGSNVNHVRV